MNKFSFLLLMSGLACLATGCVHRNRDSVSYCHPDFNTLNRPSLHFDKYYHHPPKARHVDHYRWMYNKGPIDHTLLPELYTHKPITNQTMMSVAQNGTIVPVATKSGKFVAEPKTYVTADWMFSGNSRR